MQINLKQAEIVEALKEYVGGQGINLKNKSFTVTFTAGRKEAGLLADISIETIEGAAAQEEPAEKKTLDPAEGVTVSNILERIGASGTANAASSGTAAGAGADDAGGKEDSPSAIAAAEGYSDRPLGQIPARETSSVKSLFGTN